MKIEFDCNFEDEKVLRAVKEKLTEDAMKKIKKAAESTSGIIKQMSGKKIEPQVRELKESEDGKDGYVVAISKPKEIEQAQKERIVERVWKMVPSLFKD